jgi:uncharacterized protein
VQKGGNINVQDNDGDTPLHVIDSVDVAREMVLRMGADPTIRNKEGLTPAEAMRESDGLNEVVEFLERHTSGTRNGVEDSSPLEYTDFREDEDEDEDEYRGGEADLSRRLARLMEAVEQEGLDRDGELREVVASAIMSHLGRGQGNASTTRRARRDNQDENHNSGNHTNGSI